MTAPMSTPIAKPLAHIPLFTKMNEQEQSALMSAMTRRTIEANQTIFWLGDASDALYVVSDGRVVITVPTEQGDHMTLDTLGPGGFFGEIGLLDGGPRTATVRALETTELLVLEREPFQSFLRQHPNVAIDILAVMGRRQRASTMALRGMKNPNIVFDLSRTTHWQKISDFIATVAASQAFMITHVSWFLLWVGYNGLASLGVIPSKLAFDPFPFGLLTMIVSLEAIFLSIFVMVSQSRQSEKDRIQVDLDHQVNVKAQTGIMQLGQRLERVEALQERLADALEAREADKS